MKSQKTTLPTCHKVIREKKGSDYKYRISGVPVWTSHERTIEDPRTGKSHTIKVTPQDLKAVAAKHNQRFDQDVYRGPIHEVHNGEPSADTENSGAMGKAYVATAVFEGEERDILFLDYLIEDEEQLEKIKRNPYRSVEISKKGEISSLAIMKRKAPFFKFPNFKIKENTEGMRPAKPAMSFNEVAIGYSDDQFCTLYKDTAPFEFVTYGAQESQANSEKDDYAMKDKKEEKEEQSDFDKYMSSKAGQKKMADYMDNYMSKMLDEDEDEEGEEMPPPAAKADSKPKAGKSYDDDDGLKYAEMRGEMAGLRRELAQLQEDKRRTQSINWALSNTQDVDVGDTGHFAEEIDGVYSESGVAGVELYVKGLLKNAPEIEYSEEPSTAQSHFGAATAPAEVTKYSADPVKFEQAAVAYNEFHNDLSPSMRRGLTPAQYVDSAVSESAGY